MSADQTIVHKPRIRRADDFKQWWCFGSASGKVPATSHPWNHDIVGGYGMSPRQAFLMWRVHAELELLRSSLKPEALR